MFGSIASHIPRGYVRFEMKHEIQKRVFNTVGTKKWYEASQDVLKMHFNFDTFFSDEVWKKRQFFVTFLGWLSDPLNG